MTAGQLFATDSRSFRFPCYNGRVTDQDPSTPLAVSPDWLALARDCVSAEDWLAIVRSAVEEAKGSGANAQKAREFVASFCLPKERGAASAGRVREVRLVLAPKPESK